MPTFFAAILFEILPLSYFLLPSLYNFLQLVTQLIDIMAIAVVLISIIQAIKPFLSYIIKATFRSSYQISLEYKGDISDNASTDTRSNRFLANNRYNSSKKSFVKGLLFALELESANAILKMGIFTASSVGLNQALQAQTPVQALGSDFLFFVIILSLRIAINQTLRRFS